MSNARKTSPEAGTPPCAKRAASQTTKGKNAANGARVSALPFAHRTPTQLHASTYAPRQEGNRTTS
jgi:hypothetical protein